MKGFKGKLSYRRDPHLPDPMICDWLLQQEWSENVKCVDIHFSQGEKTRSQLFDFLHATVEMGADNMIKVFAPAELLPLLRDDAQARQAIQALEELAE